MTLEATENWLSYINLPREYPSTANLAHDLDDAIMEACEDVMREWKAKDPLLRAMLDERYTLWTWATMQAGTLPAGVLVRSGTWTGRTGDHYAGLHPNHPADQPPYWASITWEHREEHIGRHGPSTRFDEAIEARVPVPFDLAPLLAEHGGAPHPPARTQPKRIGKAVPLSSPQVELLTDIATKPQMYITYGSRWAQTATALCRRGLAESRFAGSGHQYELRITEPGRVEAVRRGILNAA